VPLPELIPLALRQTGLLRDTALDLSALHAVAAHCPAQLPVSIRAQRLGRNREAAETVPEMNVAPSIGASSRTRRTPARGVKHPAESSATRLQPEFQVLCGDEMDAYMIPLIGTARSELAQQLCARFGGNHTVLLRYMSKPADGRCYNQFKIASVSHHQDCAAHRHLFDPDGGLCCVLPDVLAFGKSLGMTHPHNLYPVLNGSQQQCNGWRTEIELLISPEGVFQQAFARNSEHLQQPHWSREAFCQQHKLNSSAISKVISGER
jgi:hypothetical protein